MRRSLLFGFLVLLAVETLGQASFKLAATGAAPMTGDALWIARLIAQPWIYVAIASYLCAFATWMSLLRDAPVGPAFAASHLEVVTVTAFVAPLFGEIIGARQLGGAALIVAGIACLAVSEAKAESGWPPRDAGPASSG